MNDKLVHKFLTDRFNITVEDCDKLLTGFGYVLNKDGGSHRTYHKKAKFPITVVVQKHSRYVKPSYVDLIIKNLNLEGINGT